MKHITAHKYAYCKLKNKDCLKKLSVQTFQFIPVFWFFRKLRRAAVSTKIYIVVSILAHSRG